MTIADLPRRRHARRDPVTPETYAAVRVRDGGCVGPTVGMPGRCEGRVELDHLHNGGGLGLRGPSTPANLGRTWRPVLDEYLRRAE